jgi:hypothetical protein
VELIGPYLVACGLLVIAGVAKAVRPDDTARALVQLAAAGPSAATGDGAARHRHRPGLRAARSAVRAGATAEAVLGAVALVLPRTGTAAAVAVSYLAFAAFVALAMVRGGVLATCGCFGRPDTPPTAIHVAVNLVLAASAAAVAAAAPSTGTVAGVLRHQPWHGVPLVVVSALGTWLAGLVLVRLAALEVVRRQVGVREAHA